MVELRAVRGLHWCPWPHTMCGNGGPLTTLRLLLVLAVAVLTAGCDLIVDIFQAGLVVGVIMVALLLMVVFWIARKLRGR